MSNSAIDEHKKIVAERNRRWRESNADITQQVTVFMPKTAHQVWKDAAEKSGLFMPGLMMAVLDFLEDTPGEVLQELAKSQGREHGLRVRYIDPETDKLTRLPGGNYRRSKPR